MANVMIAFVKETKLGPGQFAKEGEARSTSVAEAARLVARGDAVYYSDFTQAHLRSGRQSRVLDKPAPVEGQEVKAEAKKEEEKKKGK